MSRLKYIDVSGVGNSGKSALVDLLREIEGIWVPHFQFEFDIVRVPGGLLDLRHNLVEDWSPIRSRACLLRFKKVAQRMGRNPRWWDLPGHLVATSQRYDRQFQGRFTSNAMAFADSFIIGSYRTEWPYDDQELAGVHLFARKVLRRIGFRKQLLREYHLVSPADFDNRVAGFLDDLYRQVTTPEDIHVVLNNAFEPFNPISALDMLEGSRQIIVTRDPRDIYVSGLNAHKIAKGDHGLMATDNDGLNKSFLGSDDLEIFVKRFRLYFEHVYSGQDPRVLHIRFEDLALDYNRTVSQVLAFLELPESSHSRQRTCFRPETSAQNIGIWKQYSQVEEIRYLEAELGKYLVN